MNDRPDNHIQWQGRLMRHAAWVFPLLVFATSFFLPASQMESETSSGFESFLVSLLSVQFLFSGDLRGFVFSGFAFTNLGFLVALWLAQVGRYRAALILNGIQSFAVTFILVGHQIAGGDRQELTLRVGYYVWMLSFHLLTVSLFVTRGLAKCKNHR